MASSSTRLWLAHQEDREIGRASRGENFGVRAAASESAAASQAQPLRLSFEGNIFGFGPPKTKMRSRLPPSALPIFL